MADEGVFPRWMYPAGGPTEPDYGGRCFNSQAELDAAEGQWFPTPQAAQEASASPRQPSVGPPGPTPDDEGTIPPRSRR